MKKPLLILYSLALLPLLYHAFASAAQSIPLTTDQKYHCAFYLEKHSAWQTYGGDLSNLEAKDWENCQAYAESTNKQRPSTISTWILVGTTDGKIYCGTCGGSDACGGNCILPS